MADKIYFKKIKSDFVKKNYPVLSNSIDTIKGLSEEQRELVAGLCVECVLKSNGLIVLFEDEISELDIEDDDY